MWTGESMPLVAPRAIEQIWDTIDPLLDRIADAKVHKEDIYRLCLDGTWMLWVNRIPETDKLISLAVTEFIEYPQLTNLRVVFLSGDDGDWLSGISIFEKFARVNKCSEVEIHGRKGWERVLKNGGYDLSHITLRKRI